MSSSHCFDCIFALLPCAFAKVRDKATQTDAPACDPLVCSNVECSVPETFRGAVDGTHQGQCKPVLESIRQELDERGFVYIPGDTYRALLKDNGAAEEDLKSLEMGDVHAQVASDPEPNMYFRQVVFHRMAFNSETGEIMEANMPAVTRIDSAEISSDEGAKVFFNRSATRIWPMPPNPYRTSTVPMAMALVSQALTPRIHHPQNNLAMDSSNIINAQVLIRITKEKDVDESPTPEGIHQDGTEVSRVTFIGRRGVTHRGESRIWHIDQPTGNYSSDSFGEVKRRRGIEEPSNSQWKSCLFDMTLADAWETIVFNDRKVKHEARGFDGARPCLRDVAVHFIRKPLPDGSDTQRIDDKAVPIYQSSTIVSYPSGSLALSIHVCVPLGHCQSLLSL